MGGSHGAATLHSPPGTRRLLLLALAPFLLVTLLGLVLLWPDEKPVAREGLGVAQQTVNGTVESVEPTPCDTSGLAPDEGEGEAPPPECATASVRLTSGSDRKVVQLLLPTGEGSFRVERGAKLVLGVEPTAPEDLRYRIVDVQRSRPMLLLALIFGVAVVGLGRWRGVAALLGLGISLLVLVKFVLPAFLTGANPLPVAVVGSAAIMFVAVFLAHGLTARSGVAVLGTLLSLGLTGLLAGAFVAAGHFTGIATEEASFLRAAYGQVDIHGLLLAGIIIGSLGVLDDVTVTQASAVWELRAANPTMSRTEVYRAGIRIGRDHIASTVNTLVLAYAGASLPLLLLFTVSGVGVGAALTSEVIAQEVVRTLIGSIGLVAAVPITTALAAYVVHREDAREHGGHDDDGTDEWIARLRAVRGGGDDLDALGRRGVPPPAAGPTDT